jgi:hypothetical protein
MKQEYWHIYPVGDSEEHNTKSQGDCWCNPKLERQENGNWLVVHNSLDGREKKERNEKPN